MLNRTPPPIQEVETTIDEGTIDTDTIPTNAREAIQPWLRHDPDMDVAALADRVGKSVRQVRRYLAAP